MERTRLLRWLFCGLSLLCGGLYSGEGGKMMFGMTGSYAIERSEHSEDFPTLEKTASIDRSVGNRRLKESCPCESLQEIKKISPLVKSVMYNAGAHEATYPLFDIVISINGEMPAADLLHLLNQTSATAAALAQRSLFGPGSCLVGNNRELQDGANTILSASAYSLSSYSVKKGFESLLLFVEPQKMLDEYKPKILEEQEPIMFADETKMWEEQEMKTLEDQESIMFHDQESNVLDEQKMKILEEEGPIMLDDQESNVLEDLEPKRLVEREATFLDDQTSMLDDEEPKMLDQEQILLDEQEESYLSEEKQLLDKEIVELKGSRFVENNEMTLAGKHLVHLLGEGERLQVFNTGSFYETEPNIAVWNVVKQLYKQLHLSTILGAPPKELDSSVCKDAQSVIMLKRFMDFRSVYNHEMIKATQPLTVTMLDAAAQVQADFEAQLAVMVNGPFATLAAGVKKTVELTRLTMALKLFKQINKLEKVIDDVKPINEAVFDGHTTLLRRRRVRRRMPLKEVILEETEDVTPAEHGKKIVDLKTPEVPIFSHMLKLKHMVTSVLSERIDSDQIAVWWMIEGIKVYEHLLGLQREYLEAGIEASDFVEEELARMRKHKINTAKAVGYCDDMLMITGHSTVIRGFSDVDDNACTRLSSIMSGPQKRVNKNRLSVSVWKMYEAVVKQRSAPSNIRMKLLLTGEQVVTSVVWMKAIMFNMEAVEKFNNLAPGTVFMKAIGDFYDEVLSTPEEAELSQMMCSSRADTSLPTGS